MSVILMDDHIGCFRRQRDIIPMGHRILPAIRHAQREGISARNRSFNLLSGHAKSLRKIPGPASASSHPAAPWPPNAMSEMVTEILLPGTKFTGASYGREECGMFFCQASGKQRFLLNQGDPFFLAASFSMAAICKPEMVTLLSSSNQTTTRFPDGLTPA